jgi:hypothetical protein
MRVTSFLWALLIAASLGIFQERFADANSTPESDHYFVAFVREALDFYKNPEHVPQSSMEARKYTNGSPSLLQLGDGVSIAVLKIYDRSELVKPENAHAYLTAVRNAFSGRSSVLEKANLDPKVTLFVLDYLREQEVSEPDIEKRISYMTGCVKDFSCSSQGEYNFFKNP